MNYNSSKAKTNTSASSSAAAKPAGHLGRLTDDNKKLLRDNNGCYKCRHINAGHTSQNCPNGFPVASFYHTLAEQLLGKNTKKDIKKIAAVTLDSNGEQDTNKHMITVAAIGPVSAVEPDSPLVRCSGVLSSDDGSDDDSVRASLVSSPHLTWNVRVEGPEQHSPVVALIDTGSPLVLICDDTVARLKFRRHRLPKAIPLGNTFDEGGVKAMEWVKLTVSTPSNVWSSVSVRAVIMSSLCSPIILGTPFLERNHILVDLYNKVLWHPPTNRDLTKPSPSSRSPAPLPVKERRTLKEEERELKDEINFLNARLQLSCAHDVVHEIREKVPTHDPTPVEHIIPPAVPPAPLATPPDRLSEMIAAI